MNEKLIIRIKAEREGARMPTYGTEMAAGADLYACLSDPIYLQPGERVLVPLGFSMELPRDFEAQVRPRSGIAIKRGVTVLNAPGTIDADYRGEMHAMLINLGNDTFIISNGDRVAQMVISYAPQSVFQWADSLSDTARGSGGFGSTGVSS